MSLSDDAAYLRPGDFIDSGDASIVSFASIHTSGIAGDREKAVALYLAVRDEVSYDVYVDYTAASSFRASGVLAQKRGFCVGKAALLAAVCRAIGIPARVGYADVRNHMTSKRLYEIMKTDVFTWHSYADLKIDGRWVKATPAFDKALCNRIGLPPLDFDGTEDSLLQALDSHGARRMEYLSFRGTFSDVPFQTILNDFRARYPALFGSDAAMGEFRNEARAHL